MSDYFSLVAILFLTSGIAAHLTIVPGTIVPEVTPNVTFSCYPGNDTVHPDGEILIMEILRNNSQGVLAIVKMGRGAFLGNVSSSVGKYSARGSINIEHVQDSLLQLVIFNPKPEDSGSYICEITFLDKDQTSHIARQDKTLSAASGGVRTINSTHLDFTLKQVEDLIMRVATLEKLSVSLTNENKEQSALIGSLRHLLTQRISFYATLSSKLNIHPSDVIIFDDVKLNEGNAYNASSGRFVVPVSGLYVFSLVVEVEAPTAVKLSVALESGSTVMARLFVFGNNFLHGGQASGSVVHNLSAGALVTVRVDAFNMEEPSQPRLVNEHFSFFTGSLLQ